MKNTDEQRSREYFYGDVSIHDAMLLYTSPRFYSTPPENPTAGQAKVVYWPEDKIDHRWSSSTGACFAWWHNKSAHDLKFKLLIEAWHAAVFKEVSPKALHDALLCIPEYRDMLADDCLPDRFRSERDGQ